MKKALRQALCISFGAMMTFSAVACGDGDGESSSGQQKYNTETRPVVFSIGALDQNFNPFFFTFADLIKVVFDLSGKLNIYNFRESFLHKLC